MNEKAKYVFMDSQKPHFFIPTRDDLWDYQVGLLEPHYGTKSKWELFQKDLSEIYQEDIEKFKSDLDGFMFDSRKVMGNVIERIKDLPKYKFSKEFHKSGPKVGHRYLHIDLAHASSQVLEKLGYFNLADLSKPESKFIRENKLSRVNSYFIPGFDRKVLPLVDNVLFDLYSSYFSDLPIGFIQVDCLDLDMTETNIPDWIKIEDQNLSGWDLHISEYEFEEIKFLNYQGHTQKMYIKRYSDGKLDFGPFYFPQIIKMLTGKEIIEEDLWYLDKRDNKRFKTQLKKL